MVDKEPKRWECIDCSHINNKTRSVFAWIEGKQRKFYVCYKCSGSIKESAEWLAWHERMVERSRPAMVAWMESRRARRLNGTI